MKKSLKRVSTVVSSLYIFVGWAGVASAQGLNSPQFKAFRSQTQFEDQKSTDLVATAGKITNQALGLLGILFTIYLVYGGFRWLTAQGDEGVVTESKKIIRNAVIGLIIALSAYAISTFVINSLVTATG